MVGKYAWVFVLAFCAVQGYNSVSISESRGAISDLLEKIDQIITDINNIILDLPKFTKNLITELRKKIREAIESIDISGIINGIEDSIEGILNSVGIDVSVARHCRDAQKVSMTNLIEDTLRQIDNCRIAAEESANQLEAELKSLASNAMSLLKEVTGGVPRCFLDHPLNPIKQAKCLTNLILEVTKKANALGIQVALTTVTSIETAAKISTTVVKCTARINRDIIIGQKEIIDDFQTCVNNIVNQQ